MTLSVAASIWLCAGCVRIPIRELSPPDGRVYGQRVGPIFDIRNACSDGGPLTGSLTEQNVHSMIGDADRRYSVKCGFLEASKSCTREEFDFRGSAIYLDILYGGLLNTEVQSTHYILTVDFDGAGRLKACRVRSAGIGLFGS